ncbi:uncharacterized protein LOC18438745 isoform X2 [Amborella trichopoda]|uniref:uncharacterized protein LOC18438745 isoform X2 n=1 Tax=Amborella trichopoda TaxID=13333 RepID=UPI0005D40627|nr:uncharacterized protein LOC18438745 isoform X2 [Amborella trichopoda]|eukprot:XP_011625127.1 uncharacterized protein LOC18438745 isoform X2 [Amborella trichopoda]
MSGIERKLVDWNEEFVSQERGGRIVHYYVRDDSGNSVLAVVGTERSVRHMVYVVAEGFMESEWFQRPPTSSSSSGNGSSFKWRSKREVVDWLSSLLSDGNRTLKCDASVSGFDEREIYHNRKGLFARKLKGTGDIVWSSEVWTCGKQLRHYHSFCRNGTLITIHSFVLVMSVEGDHHLAYIEDMYEDKKGRKKVKARWFHQNQEVAGMISPPQPHLYEVFITPHSQVLSAECVDGLVPVLTPKHYDQCLAALPPTFSGRTHLCSRQFGNGSVKPFDVSKLHGYYNQKILSCIDLYTISKYELTCKSPIPYGEEEAGHIKVGPRKSRSSRGRQKGLPEQTQVEVLDTVNGLIGVEPVDQCSRFGRHEEPFGVKQIGQETWASQLFKTKDKIEVLCQDSGIRGCWFRCTVLEVSRKQLKVCYDDLLSEDESGNLEEWVPAFRLAATDKLGMRCSGRLTVRPSPPESLCGSPFRIGTPVDTWWNDGWWEGVIVRISDDGIDTLQVYFPGEDVLLAFQRENLRISKDWVRNRWVDVKEKPDILSSMTDISSSPKLLAWLQETRKTYSSARTQFSGSKDEDTSRHDRDDDGDDFDDDGDDFDDDDDDDEDEDDDDDGFGNDGSDDGGKDGNDDDGDDEEEDKLESKRLKLDNGVVTGLMAIVEVNS